jgi:hypothetical protein
MLPQPGQVIISVWNGRTAVSRYERVEDTPNAIYVQEATNWQDLEDDALAEVEDQDGSRTQSGHYLCSVELAERAIFSEEGHAHVD